MKRSQANGRFVPQSETLERRDVPSVASDLYVNELYREFLRRTPATGEAASWSAALDAGAPRVAIAQGIAASQEGREVLANDYFLRHLKRAAEPTARAAYGHALGSAPSDVVRASILGSPEYFAKAGSTDATYLAALYVDVLGRPLDPVGNDYWSGKLAGGIPRADIALELLRTPEADQQTVREAYLAILDRPAEASGLAAWTAAVQAGMRDLELFAYLAASEEKHLSATRTPPTISAIEDVVTGEVPIALDVTVGDLQTPATSLVVTATSSNAALVSAAVSGSGAGRTVNVTPGTGTGVATITVTVTDGDGMSATETFTVTIEALRGGAVSAEAYLGWNESLLSAVVVGGTAPPVAARAIAILNVAQHDVTAAFDGVPGFFLTQTPPANADRAAALAAAARTVLVSLFPSQTSAFDAKLTSILATIPDGAAETAGVSFGTAIGNAILALRAADGSTASVTYTSSGALGAWVPTPPGFAAPALPQWPGVTPFALDTGSEFRVPAPPALTSAQWKADLAEVRSLGKDDSTTRTNEQTEIALFWADNAGTVTPPGHWVDIAIDQIRAAGFNAYRTSQAMTALGIALADAGIAAWDVKYTYATWRPITAIRELATLNDPSLAADPTWSPLMTTPNHPEYVSGHSTFSRAAAVVLEKFFGTNHAFTTDGVVGASTVTRSFASFAAAADEAGRSRIFGGIHFDFSNHAGQTLGAAVGAKALEKLGI